MKATCILLAVVTAGSTLAQTTQSEGKTNAAEEGKRFFSRLRESSLLHYQLATRKHDQVFETLPSVEDIDAIEPVSGTTALTLAARDETSDAYDVVQAMVLRYGADPTATDRSGFTALHFAAQAGNLPVVEFLVNQGADLNATPKKRRCVNCGHGVKTPLYLAYQRDRGRVVAFLESRGARPLDSETQETLDLQAEMLAILDKFKYRRPPKGIHGAALEEWHRRRLNDAFDEATNILRPSGHADTADRLDQSREPLLKALKNTPRHDGMSFTDWKRQIIANMFANIERENSNLE